MFISRGKMPGKKKNLMCKRKEIINKTMSQRRPMGRHGEGEYPPEKKKKSSSLIEELKMTMHEDVSWKGAQQKVFI